MTFNKIEFWLVTLVALVFISAIITAELIHPGSNGSNHMSSKQTAETIGKLGLVIMSYITFLFQNYFVFGYVYKRKQYDLLIFLSLVFLVILIASFSYLGSNVPQLLQGTEYISITATIFGIFFLYCILKKVVEYYTSLANKSEEKKILLRRKITLEVVYSSLIWTIILLIIFNSHYKIKEIIMPFWLAWIPCAFILIMLSIYWLIPASLKKSKGFYSYWFKASLLTFVLSFPFGLVFASGNVWMFIGFIFTQLLVTLPFAWLFYRHDEDRISEILSLKKELGKTSADLQLLRSQINPHFLFNALNTLYGTALQEESARTAKGIQKLGDMMRFMIHENLQDFISLDKEIEYLRNYISLQQLRIQDSDHIDIDVQLNELKGHYLIAPMLLIPFVENAFKHGISLKDKSWIRISFSCREDKLFFDVCNSLHLKNEDEDPERGMGGIGIINVQQRLEMTYPEKHELLIRETSNEHIIHLTVMLSPIEKEMPTTDFTLEGSYFTVNSEL